MSQFLLKPLSGSKPRDVDLFYFCMACSLKILGSCLPFPVLSQLYLNLHSRIWLPFYLLSALWFAYMTFSSQHLLCDGLGCSRSSCELQKKFLDWQAHYAHHQFPFNFFIIDHPPSVCCVGSRSGVLTSPIPRPSLSG